MERLGRTEARRTRDPSEPLPQPRTHDSPDQDPCSGGVRHQPPERGSQDVSPEDRLWSVDIGFIGQNVSMFCASEGLATVFYGAVDDKKLDRTKKLAEGQFVS
jgi:nitroreductase